MEVVELNSTQEEADTRMYLHAAYAARTYPDVIIVSPDTDVLVIGITLQPSIKAHLYFHTGRGANLRTIDVKAIQSCVGEGLSKALIGLHCFTGCDSVSAFYGKGKKKAFDLLRKDETLLPAFQDLGEQFDVRPDMVTQLDKFVCRLYGQADVDTVNSARCDMFRFSGKSELAMPPNHDSLTQHIKRANYQAGIYKRSLQATPDVPPPQDHGWKIEGEDLVVEWMTLPPAPDSVMELAHCVGSCKRSNCSDVSKCSCLENNVPCTDRCSCARTNCSNIAGQLRWDDGVEEDLEDSGAEEDQISGSIEH